MIDQLVARLEQPRFGIPFLTAVTSLVMSTHWAPMAVPSLALLGFLLPLPFIGGTSPCPSMSNMTASPA